MFSRFWFAPFLGLWLAGCGGGANPTPLPGGPTTIEAALSRSDFFDANDNRNYDIYVCEPLVGGVALVEMRSLDIDSQLYIYRRDGGGDYDLIARNDNFNGRDALIEFPVARGEVLRVVATSSRSNERGEYQISFSEILGRPARVVQSAAVPLRLPPIESK